MRIAFEFICALILIGCVTCQAPRQKNYSGTIDETGIYTWDEKDSLDLEYYGGKRINFRMMSGCQAGDTEKDFISVILYNTKTLETVLFDEIECSKDLSWHHAHSNPHMFNEKYNIRVIGKPNYEFVIQLNLELTDIDIDSEGVGEALVTLDGNSRTIKTFSISYDQIKTTNELSYIQVSVESNDTFEDPSKNSVALDTSWTHGCGVASGDESKRSVAKLIVTQTHEDLDNFFDNPDAAITASMRLSFSCFGMITISNASEPVLNTGEWVVGVTLDENSTSLKKVMIRVTVVTDYHYVGRIATMFGVSLIGIVIPFLARLIFDAGNINIFKNVHFKTWLTTVGYWFWRGHKAATFLVAVVAALLVVSAFQIVHARHHEMMRTGDRDLCYYNEKCYRPYGHYYDVSVNGLASNIPFMVQGVMMILYFSLAESHCRANDHEHFDYSLPYALGLTFICEGFGSLIYHICPSQIIFQFDTLFMFIISLISITAIYEGLSIRDNDVKYSRVATQKTVRPIKIFALFVGPVYFFNFIGNLSDADRGLPFKVMVPFYVIFGLWWAGTLSWMAYKMDLMPKCLDPKHPPYPEEVPGADPDHVKRSCLVEWAIKHYKVLKAIAFVIYCGIVIAGFVFALLQKVAFSMFILGVLIIAMVVMLVVYFLPVADLVVSYFQNVPAQLKKDCCTTFRYIFVLIGMVLFLLIGCAVVIIALVLFQVFSTTDKSLDPWLSREENNPCFLNNFYDTHDFWHLFASFGLMILSMLIVQISKPCRECYLVYMTKTKEDIASAKATFGSVGVVKST